MWNKYSLVSDSILICNNWFWAVLNDKSTCTFIVWQLLLFIAVIWKHNLCESVRNHVDMLMDTLVVYLVVNTNAMQGFRDICDVSFFKFAWLFWNRYLYASFKCFLSSVTCIRKTIFVVQIQWRYKSLRKDRFTCHNCIQFDEINTLLCMLCLILIMIIFLFDI